MAVGLVNIARVAALIAAALLPGQAARAEEAPLALSLAYVGDTAATLSGGSDRDARYLGNLDIVADADLDALLGLRATRLHVYALHNHGQRPNDSAGTLQGVNNIEVGSPGLRLFEAWVEHDFGRASLRAGLYDLNSEFYAQDAAGLLIAPAFGIGSELAGTGPAGPSIFPSTALAARLAVELDGQSQLRLAAFNARAQTFGDPGGVDLGFADGLLLIGEAAHQTGSGLTLSAGAWGYTRGADHVFDLDAAGQPVQRRAWGGYAMAEGQAWGSEDRGARFFLRGGFSAGGTTPYGWAGQAGLLMAPAFAGRADSAFSVGVHHASIQRGYRDLLRAGGDRPAGHETGVELTYADKLLPFLTLQPDLQAVFNPGGRADAPMALVATLRVTVEFGFGSED